MWEFPGVCFRSTGGVSGIHEWGLLWTGRGYRGETLQNERECLGLPLCLKTCVCICMSACMWGVNERVQEAGYCFIGNTIVL